MPRNLWPAATMAPRQELPRIVASVLPAGFVRPGDECQALDKPGVDRIQRDVMESRAARECP